MKTHKLRRQVRGRMKNMQESRIHKNQGEILDDNNYGSISDDRFVKLNELSHEFGVSL